MDPGLQELIAEGDADDEVAVVVRFHHKAAAIPSALRVVARFGTVATARTRRGALRALHADPAIASLKAPRLYSAELHVVHAEETEADTPLPGDQRRPGAITETGRGSVICVLDWSLDLAHPDFRKADGGTRLLALWDQRPRSTAVRPYGYGRVHDRAAIDRALAGADPFATLDYRPADAAHGTHVMGIAAGNGRAGGPAGVAPEADLIFVHLSGGGDDDLGSSIELLEGIDFAARTAGDRPLVINMSLGRHAGPHDGSLLIERAIDALLVERPGTAVVQSTGNYFSRRVHMRGRISEGRRAQMPLHRARASAQPVSLEIWYPGADAFDASLRGPTGITARAAQGDAATLTAGGATIGHLYHRRADPNNGDNLVNLILQSDAPLGEWTVEVEGVDVVDGRWHAWIERDTACAACQAQFPADLAVSETTTGSICNALRTVAVGAFDANDRDHAIPPFSSAGPTRDGRRKPLLSAPGVRVLAPRSRSNAGAAPGYVRMSGTSMAAPHVAGTMALMMEAAGRQKVSLLRRTLFTSLDAAEGDENRRGYGLLNVESAVEHARALRRPTETVAPAEPGDFPPSGLSGAIDPTLASILRLALDPADPSITVAGWPGQRLIDEPLAGDLLLHRGIGDAGRVLRVDDSRLLRPPAVDGRLPGRYVMVSDGPGQLAPPPRRLIGPDGLVIADTYLLRIAQPGEGATPALSSPRPIIRQGSSGPAVAEAQSLLNNIDIRRRAGGNGAIAACPLAIDGIFGVNTHAATLSFQHAAFPAQPNEWDGVIGARTWALLDLFARGDAPPVTPPNGNDNPPITPVVFSPPDPTRWGPILSGMPNAPLTTQNAVRALIDGPEAYGAMASDIRAAQGPRSFIYLLGWDCFDNFPLEPGAPVKCDTSLNHLLRGAVAAGVQVRAMIWQNLTKPLAIRDVAARINALGGASGNGACIVDGRGGGNAPIDRNAIDRARALLTGATDLLRFVPGDVGAEWRRISGEINDAIDNALRMLISAHHQKVLLVFNGDRLVGYCGGIDLNPNRSTDATNCIPGTRAQAIEPSDPQHDTHCRIVGPAASELLRTFVDRWLDHPEHGAIDSAKSPLRGDPVSAVPSPPVPNPGPVDAPFGGSASVIVARTYNPPARGRIPRQRDIQTLLLRAIANARRFIYLEDQYLWDFDTPAGGTPSVATALNRALPRLAHVTALIPANAISSPGFFQRAWRSRFIAEVTRGHPPAIANRFRIFQPNRGTACSPDGCLGRHSYVHSKCWVIDDELAVIGSANCNRRGYQHDSEIDAFVFDDTAPGGGAPVIFTAMRGEMALETNAAGETFAQQFRRRLWREHLGVTVNDGTDVSAWPSGGAPVGNVVPFIPDRPQLINATADRRLFTVIDQIAELVRPVFDPAA